MSLGILSGCQQDIVQSRSNKLASTVTTLYYEQVLTNLAMTIAKPDMLPYFGVPTQGTHTNVRQFTAGYTPMWDYLTTGMKPFSGHYFFDKQAAPLTGGVQNQESFQLQPISNPDRLMLLQAAFHRATGYPNDGEMDQALDTYSNSVDAYAYTRYIVHGWYHTTTSAREARKNGVFCGHYGDIRLCN